MASNTTICNSSHDADAAVPKSGNSSANVSHSNNLKIFFSNVRSIVNKINDFRSLVCEYDFDVIIVNESWLNNNIPDKYVIENYNLYRRDRSKGRGGGVFIAVKDIYKCAQKFIDSNYEDIFVVIFIKNKRILICTLYRPPHEHID